MKLLGTVLLLAATVACVSGQLDIDAWINYAANQYSRLAETIPATGQFISTGDPTSATWRTTDQWSWTAGFYAGSLWMLFKLTGDEKWKDLALANQEGLRERQYDTGTHDLGFVLMSSFGHALELTGDKSYETVLINAADSLSTRFFDNIGVFRSWNNYGSDDQNEVKVIVDNMMNLELLFKATEFTQNGAYALKARLHALKTIQEHYRADYGTYHVVAYDEATGNVLRKYSAQGYADNSTWARGQAWGIYGYVTMFQYTADPLYLQQAERASQYFIDHLPEDLIPFWDFNAPNETSYQPRDTSAAAVSACAFIQLYNLTQKNEYLDLSLRILQSLVTTSYISDGIADYQIPSILVNGTVFYNQNDFNTAITYADYYFLRALDMLKQLE